MQQTFSHLMQDNQPIDEYNILSHGLLYHHQQGYELENEITQFFSTFQPEGITLKRLQSFDDPRKTTYQKYVTLQADQEQYAQKLLKAANDTTYHDMLSKPWVEAVIHIYNPIRYPIHALQMLIAYLGQFGLSSKITIATAFQAADEMRRLNNLTGWVYFYDKNNQHLQNGKSVWTQAALWQPMREFIETSLITYPWLESLIRVQIFFKPLFDMLFMKLFAQTALKAGDQLFHQMLISLYNDCRWHLAWNQRLCQCIFVSRKDKLHLKNTGKKLQDEVMASFTPLTTYCENLLSSTLFPQKAYIQQLEAHYQQCLLLTS